MEVNQSTDTPKYTTTLGDYIEAITEVAMNLGKSEKEAHEIASKAAESALFRQKSNNISAH